VILASVDRPGSASATTRVAVATPSPTRSSSPAQSRDAVAQQLLGQNFTLVGARATAGADASSSSDQSPEIEQWKASNGDTADITWQVDNATLDEEAPQTAQTASGQTYHIRHAPNGSVSIIMSDNGNAIIYTRIDPRVDPTDKVNGVVVSDAPSDQTLISQAEQLLAAS
jgi:hypothetical protein